MSIPAGTRLICQCDFQQIDDPGFAIERLPQSSLLTRPLAISSIAPMPTLSERCPDQVSYSAGVQPASEIFHVRLVRLCWQCNEACVQVSRVALCQRSLASLHVLRRTASLSSLVITSTGSQKSHHSVFGMLPKGVTPQRKCALQEARHNTKTKQCVSPRMRLFEPSNTFRT